MKRTRLIAFSLLMSSCWALSGGCMASNGSSGNVGGSSSNGGAPGGGSGGSNVVITPGSSGSGGTNQAALDPLCGVADETGDCVPDDASACRDYSPPASAGGAGGSAGESGGGQNAGGQGGAPSHEGGQAGAVFMDGGASQGGAAGGAAGAGGEGGQDSQQPPELASYSCQVTSQNNLLTRQCVRAGAGVANAPCFGAADCAPSFACVTDGEAGRCLPYCCAASTSCAAGTYCAEQPLRRSQSAATSPSTPRVPVCVPADGCSLEDKFPCPAGDDCRCTGDTACMVVRHDGTTACVKPGSGQQGDACPCAWNHICSSVTQQCAKICRTDSDSDCGTQKCQASAELPPNFGVCVGPLP